MDRPLLSILDAPVAFVDVETTGGDNVRNRIIEIGLVAATGGELEYEWSTLVNPGSGIPPAIVQFTGITDEMVRHAPFFEDIVGELARRLEGRLFVAHNARFDYGFFRGEFRRAGRKFSSRVACTVKLSRRLYPHEARHNLDAVIERLGLACERRNRALPDAQALWQLWQQLRATRDRGEVETALEVITQLKSLPPHLPPDLADRLPEGPGVYRFYGENDALLYVGKAKDVRQRVLAHWQGATRDDKAHRLAELVRRIEWDETAG
ncbi:MAG TPA: exonuclease domain-containing protein, partial [Steroidobacteraceae bacterium]|nr:exonuclease domain-containing protein [Steroidobacteraceae bacterium]